MKNEAMTSINAARRRLDQALALLDGGQHTLAYERLCEANRDVDRAATTVASLVQEDRER